MDAFDLFKKLGAGAKFDFKRFRSDAEKLHILKPKQDVQKDTIEIASKPLKGISDLSDDNNDFSDEEQDNNAQDKLNDQAPSDSDDNDSAGENDSAENDSSSESSSDSESGFEPETELKLLGNMKATGTERPENYKELRKERKKKQKKSVDPAQKAADLKQEQINHTRNVNRIHAYGTDIPEPFETFGQLQAEYGLHSHIIQNIESIGYRDPTPIQMQAIPVMLQRREVMACAPTGSGKTAAFILPILHQLREPRNDGIRALVLSPTRELAQQTYREFQRLSEGIGFRTLYIDKIGNDPNKIKKLSKKVDILVSTPNRLVYLLSQTPPLLSLTSVQWLVVDESDKLFEEGKSGFRDQLALIYKSCDGTNLCRAMFSATFAFDVEQWCKLNLDNVVQVYIGARNSATKTIEQSLVFCGAETGKMIALRNIIRQGIQPPVLVFVQSKERAKELFHELIYDGMNVDVIHSDRTQLQRDNVIKAFRSGKIWILICTELMGRGIDFKGVNLVINYDFPNSAISYIHRIGRTGRAGRRGKAVTFFTEDDAIYLRSIANVMRTAGCPVPEYMLKINQPNRRERKVLSKGSIQRPKISTMTKYDLQKLKHKRQIIQDSKRKKEGNSSNQAPNFKGQKRKFGGGEKFSRSDDKFGKKQKFDKESTRTIQMKYKHHGKKGGKTSSKGHQRKAGGT